jgi:hypothetical protein
MYSLSYSWFWSCWLSWGVPIWAIMRCIDETAKKIRNDHENTENKVEMMQCSIVLCSIITILKDFLNVGSDILSQTLEVCLAATGAILVWIRIAVHDECSKILQRYILYYCKCSSLYTETRNTRPPVSNPIMWQFEKQNVPPKLFFLTLFLQSIMKLFGCGIGSGKKVLGEHSVFQIVT